MTRNEFIAEFAELLGVRAEELRPETEMATIPSWDSVAWLGSLVLIDEKLGTKVRPEELSGARTFQDILEAVAAGLEG